MLKVSIVISTYNRSSYVCEAIDSVLRQDFKDFEIIVVDDGSTDNTKEALSKYKNIRYVYQENKGRSEARNTGIKAARAEYVAFLDDDDIWLEGKLYKQVVFLDSHPETGLVHTLSEVVNEEGNILGKETEKRLNFYKQAIKIGYTYEGMSRLCIMFLSTVMLRKECFNQVGFFDGTIPAFEDWDFYLRFVLKYKISLIPEILVKYKLHKKNTSSNEFIHGRIQTALKHLAMLDSLSCRRRAVVSFNFYMQLASFYYMNLEFGLFREYARKAFFLNPLIILRPRLLLHFLFSMLPLWFIHKIRFLKNNGFRKVQAYPERIIPRETFGGPLAVHMKRYEFAMPFCAGKVVLDAACGVGYGSVYLADGAKEVTGVDISDAAIAYAKGSYQKQNIQFKPMNIQKLEFPGAYFDVVVSFETLEHLDEPLRFILEVKRVLKDDGIFIVSSPQVKKTTYNLANPYHKVEFSYQDFAILLGKYFKNIEIFGERRKQSGAHYFLQKADIFHLRRFLPIFLRRKITHSIATSSWDEAGLKDFVISKEGIKRATELVGVCRGKIK